MRAELLRKIEALADDERGDPATRARAQEKVAAYRQSHPHLFAKKPRLRDAPPPDPRHYGLRRDPAYEYYIFCDLSQWSKTAKGNLTYTVYHGGTNHKIVLFKHRKTDTFGWMRVDEYYDNTEFSGRFRTLGEAHKDAWASLMMS